MKKLTGIVLLSLLLSFNAYSKTIELKKCSSDSWKYNPKEYEKKSYIVNYDKSLVQRVNILTDEFLLDQKQKLIADGKKELANLVDKITVNDFEIDYADNKYVKAKNNYSINDKKYTSVLEIDLKKKIVYYQPTLSHEKSIYNCK